MFYSMKIILNKNQSLLGMHLHVLNAVPATKCASQRAIIPDKTANINSNSCNLKVPTTSWPARKAFK